MPIIARISPFQVGGFHLDISLQSFPGPWASAPSSSIYRSRNSAPKRQFSAGLFSMKTGSNRAKKTALSSVRCALQHIPTSARSHPSFSEWWALKIPHFCGKRDITELHPATPHIDRISPFQVYRIYQEMPLQYFRNTLVSAPCSDISRCRNCAQNLPMAQIPPAFILPLLSPLSTTLGYPFSQCPSSNLLRGNPDLGRAFSSLSSRFEVKLNVLNY